MAVKILEVLIRWPVIKIVKCVIVKKIQSLRKHFKILQHTKVMPNINYHPKHRRVKVLVSRELIKEFTVIRRTHCFKCDSSGYLKDI